MIRPRQGLRETLREDTRTRIQMRLEDDGHVPVSGDDVRLTNRGLHLGRVMSVVVEKTARADLTAGLKATGRARKLTQAVSDCLRLQPTLDAGYPGSGRIQDVMLARYTQRQRCATLSPRQRRASPVSFHVHVGDYDIGITQRPIRTPVRHDAQPLGAGGIRETNRPLVLRAGHQQAAGDQSPRKLNENLLELLT